MGHATMEGAKAATKATVEGAKTAAKVTGEVAGKAAKETKYAAIDATAATKAKAESIARDIKARSDINEAGIIGSAAALAAKASMEAEDNALAASEAAAKAAVALTGGTPADVPIKVSRLNLRYNTVIGVVTGTLASAEQYQEGSTSAKLISGTCKGLLAALATELTQAISLNQTPGAPLVYPPRTPEKFLKTIIDDCIQFNNVGTKYVNFPKIIGMNAPLYTALVPMMPKYLDIGRKLDNISMSEVKSTKMKNILKESDVARIKDAGKQIEKSKSSLTKLENEAK